MSATALLLALTMIVPMIFTVVGALWVLHPGER